MAGAGLEGAHARLCEDAACKIVKENYYGQSLSETWTGSNLTIATWEQSLKVILPTHLTPPTFLEITTPSSLSPAAAATSYINDSSRTPPQPKIQTPSRTPSLTSPPASMPSPVAVATVQSRVLLALNAPDVWWVQNGYPGTMVNGSGQVDARHPSWINTTITAGQPLRVFGRSLAWDERDENCLNAAAQPGPVASTMLYFNDTTLIGSALRANCFEAEFATPISLTPGVHMGTVRTHWGQSTQFGIRVLAPPPPPAPYPPSAIIDVNKDFGGNLSLALQHAAEMEATVPKVVQLGTGTGITTYNLTSGVHVPPNTTVSGSGMSHHQTTVNFAVPRPPPPSSANGTCSTLQPVDFYAASCNRTTQVCFADLAIYDNVTNNPAACCDRCGVHPGCSAFTLEYQLHRGYICILKACQMPSGAPAPTPHTCPTTPRSTGSSTVSAYNTAAPAPPLRDDTSALTVSSDVRLDNFSLVLTEDTTVAQYVAVYMPVGAQRFVVSGMRVEMRQNNVSNAFKIFGSQFVIEHSTVIQSGSCLWPGYGPDSDKTPFQPSVTLRMQNAADGWVHHNLFKWRCSFMDLDVSNRVVMEDNIIQDTEPGVVPHGNSISNYQYTLHPSSRFWSYARNHMTRPPSSDPRDRQQWTQRETVTTDGDGWWGSGCAERVVNGGEGLVLDANFSREISSHHGSSGEGGDGSVLVDGGQALLTLKVMGGPGTGQTRMVTGWNATTRTLLLESPLDGYFAAGLGRNGSILALLSSVGSKAIVGNTFNWTEVVQWYSNTLGGIMADNSLSDCNVRAGGNAGNASMGAYGACYNGPGPVWFTEFTGNSQVRSDGISLLDHQTTNSGKGSQVHCAAYRGAYIRWAVMRRNTVAGISLSSRSQMRCGSVSNSNLNSTDLVSEHNVIECPEGGHVANADSGAHWPGVKCSHCVERP